MRFFNKIKISIAAASILCISNACTKEFNSLNTNPALVTEEVVKPDNIFSMVEKESIFHIPDLGRLDGPGRISEFAGYMASESSGSPFKNMEYDFYFTNFYRTYLINVNETIRLTQDPSMSNKNAIAKIFRVWLWQNLTDMYGDVPYTEAALDKEHFIAEPKYDTQESIYRSLFTELKAATAQLNDDPSLASFGNADLLYGGDVTAWKKFANSLRLRMALRVRYADNGLAQENVNDVINEPLISANDENATLWSEGASAANENNRSPLQRLIKNNLIEPRHLGFPVLEIMAKNNDPRMPVYFKVPNAVDPTSSIPYRARPINVYDFETDRYVRDSISLVGDYFEGDKFPFNLITAAEVSFLKSEAALAGLGSGDANQFYRDGIQLSMEQYGVSAGDIATFLAQPDATLAGTEEQKLEQIIDQKYVAIVYQSNEAWAEYRRTGYPKMWLGTGPTDTDGQIPRRLTYLADEYSKNTTNVQEAATHYPGGDKLTSRVWWDAKAGVPFAHPRQGIFPPETW
jgi:hypothetical protein